MHSVTDRQTDRRTDNNVMPMAKKGIKSLGDGTNLTVEYMIHFPLGSSQSQGPGSSSSWSNPKLCPIS